MIASKLFESKERTRHKEKTTWSTCAGTAGQRSGLQSNKPKKRRTIVEKKSKLIRETKEKTTVGKGIVQS